MTTTWRVGKGTDEDIIVEFDIGAVAANPKIKFDSTTDTVEIATDGVVYTVVADSGGEGVGATLNLFNNTGSQINEGQLCYIGAWNAAQTSYEVGLSIVTGTPGTTLYAGWIASANIADQAKGSFGKTKILTSLNTSGGTVGRPVYLGTVAGGWSVALPALPNLVQIVGQIIEVHATTGRIILDPQAPLEANQADTI
jgi:hypothetical protein